MTSLDQSEASMVPIWAHFTTDSQFEEFRRGHLFESLGQVKKIGCFSDVPFRLEPACNIASGYLSQSTPVTP